MKTQFAFKKTLFKGVFLSLLASWSYSMDTKDTKSGKKNSETMVRDTGSAAAPLEAQSSISILPQTIAQKITQLTDDEWTYLHGHILAFRASCIRYEKLKRIKLEQNPKNSVLLNFALHANQISLARVLKFFKQRNIADDGLAKVCTALQSSKFMNDAQKATLEALAHLSVALTQQDKIVFLGAQGIAQHAQSDSSFEDLIEALIMNMSEGIKRSLFSGTQPNFNKLDLLGHTPLFYAVYSNEPKAVALLLANGADATYFNDQGLCASLLTFPDSEGKQIEQLLKKYGACVNVKNRQGTTPFMAAAKSGNRDNFDALIQSKAEVSAHDNQGKTAYYFASEKLNACKHEGHEHCCPFAYLQEKSKCSLDVIDTSNDMTPLMTAAKAGNMDMVHWLLRNGADIKKTGDYNKSGTAYSLAANDDVKKLLELKGAKEFEEQHGALQAKRREEIRLRLLQTQQKKKKQTANEPNEEFDVQEGLEDSESLVKVSLFGMFFLWSSLSTPPDSDPLILEFTKNLLQRSLVRFVLDFKKKQMSPQEMIVAIGPLSEKVEYMGDLLGAERLTKGSKKRKKLNSLELIELIYAQEDQSKSPESEKNDTCIDLLLFEALWQCFSSKFSSELSKENQLHGISESLYKKILNNHSQILRQASTIQEDSFGYAPLHYALLLKDRKLIADLIEAGVSLVSCNKQHEQVRPLDIAIRMGDANILRAFLSVVSQHHKEAVHILVNEPGAQGKVALMHAYDVRKDNQKIISMLKAYGAHIDSEGLIDRLTPLCRAVQRNNRNEIQACLALGADTQKMVNGKRAIQLTTNPLIKRMLQNPRQTLHSKKDLALLVSLNQKEQEQLSNLIEKYGKAMDEHNRDCERDDHNPNSFQASHARLAQTCNELGGFFSSRGIRDDQDGRLTAILKKINREKLCPTIEMLIARLSDSHIAVPETAAAIDPESAGQSRKRALDYKLKALIGAGAVPCITAGGTQPFRKSVPSASEVNAGSSMSTVCTGGALATNNLMENEDEALAKTLEKENQELAQKIERLENESNKSRSYKKKLTEEIIALDKADQAAKRAAEKEATLEREKEAQERASMAREDREKKKRDDRKARSQAAEEKLKQAEQVRLERHKQGALKLASLCQKVVHEVPVEDFKQLVFNQMRYFAHEQARQEKIEQDELLRQGWELSRQLGPKTPEQRRLIAEYEKNKRVEEQLKRRKSQTPEAIAARELDLERSKKRREDDQAFWAEKVAARAKNQATLFKEKMEAAIAQSTNK